MNWWRKQWIVLFHNRNVRSKKICLIIKNQTKSLIKAAWIYMWLNDTNLENLTFWDVLFNARFKSHNINFDFDLFNNYTSIQWTLDVKFISATTKKVLVKNDFGRTKSKNSPEIFFFSEKNLEKRNLGTKIFWKKKMFWKKIWKFFFQLQVTIPTRYIPIPTYYC